MSQDDPVPLKAQPGASPELVRALAALGSEGTDPERLARVAERLGSLLDAPPPPLSASARVLRFVRRKLTGGKLVLTGMAVGAAVYGGSQLVAKPRPATEPAAPAAAPSPASLAAEAPEGRAVEAPAPAPEAARGPELAPGPTPGLEAVPDAPPDPAPRGRRAANEVRRAPPRTPPEASRTPPTDPVARVGSDGSDGQPASTASAPAPVAPEPAPPPAAPRRAEAQILSEARKLVVSDPAAALRLSEEHARLYENGLLSPEREVLAIEALRALGRTQAAEQRLARFRARYPDSLHLRRLERAQP